MCRHKLEAEQIWVLVQQGLACWLKPCVGEGLVTAVTAAPHCNERAILPAALEGQKLDSSEKSRLYLTPMTQLPMSVLVGPIQVVLLSLMGQKELFDWSSGS